MRNRRARSRKTVGNEIQEAVKAGQLNEKFLELLKKNSEIKKKEKITGDENHLFRDPIEVPGQKYGLISCICANGNQKFRHSLKLEQYCKKHRIGREGCEELVKMVEEYTSLAVKFRGAFHTREQAAEHAKRLTQQDSDFDIHIADLYEWLHLPPPDPEFIEDEVFQEEKLNEMVRSYKKDRELSKLDFEKRKEEMKKNPQPVNAEIPKHALEAFARAGGSSVLDGDKAAVNFEKTEFDPENNTSLDTLGAIPNNEYTNLDNISNKASASVLGNSNELLKKSAFEKLNDAIENGEFDKFDEVNEQESNENSNEHSNENSNKQPLPPSGAETQAFADLMDSDPMYYKNRE